MKIHIAVIKGIDRDFSLLAVRGIAQAHSHSLGQYEYELHFFEPQYQDRKETIRDSVERAVLSALSLNPHVILTIGIMASQVTKEVTETILNPIPVVFIASGEPVHHKLVNNVEKTGNHLSGVELELASEVITAQAILKSNPYTHKILIACNPLELEGRVGQASRKLIEYFNKNGKFADIVETRSIEKAVVAKNILNNITDHDTILFIAGDRSGRAYTAINEYCSNNQIHLIAPGKESIKQGATAGFSYDIEFLGEEGYREAAKIATQRATMSPQEFWNQTFRVRFIKNTFKMVVRKIYSRRGGVALLPDTITNHEKDPDSPVDPFISLDNTRYSTNPQCNIGLIAPRSMPQWHAIYKTLIRLCDKRKNIDFKMQPIEIDYTDTFAYTKNTVSDIFKALEEHASKTGVQYDVLLVADTTLYKIVERISKKLSISIPTIVLCDLNREPLPQQIANTDSVPKSSYGNYLSFQKLPHIGSANMLTLFIKEQDPETPLTLIKKIKPDAQNILLITDHSSQSEPNSLFIGKALELIKKSNISCTLATDINEEDHKAVDAIIIDDHSLSLGTINRVREFCETHTIPLLGCGVELTTQNIGLTSGRNWHIASQFLLDQIIGKQLLGESKSLSDIGAILIEPYQQTVLNVLAWEKQMGVCTSGHRNILPNLDFIEPYESFHTTLEIEPVVTIVIDSDESED